ncbi:MAG TPA: hypothetical protein DIV40_05915 [Clostridiales bacterium]|nr:hypothetical protein [Clostridiales bacterium]
MKSDKEIKIDNKLKNKGVILPDDMTFADLLQNWNYYSRFMFDLIEGKADYCLISQDEKAKSNSAAEFKAFLKYWFEYAEKTIPDNNIKIVVRGLYKNEK